MSSTGNNNNSSKHLHHHFSRSQLEKIINLRINSQQCHDSKCKKEKECFQQALTKMAQTFSEVFALYEKQRIEMHKIYVIHTKICEEFGMPNKITRPTELDEQKLSKIAKRIQEFLVDSNSFKAKTGQQQNATATAAPTSSTSNNTKVYATEAAPQSEIKSISSGSKIEVLPVSNSNVQSSHNSQLLEMRKRKSTTPATTIPNSDVLMQSTNNSNTMNRFCSGTPQTASNFTASNFHSFNGGSSKSNFSLAPTAQLAHPKPNSGFSAAFPSNCVPLQQQGCLISNGHTLQNKNISIPTPSPLIYQSRELSVDYGNRDICTKRLKLNNQIFKVPAPIPMIDDDVIQID